MTKLRYPSAPAARAVALSLLAIALAGCGRFSKHEGPSKYVFVTAKEATLRDRVAAVSNRTGMVQNGDKLTVLSRARRFVQVRTADGKVGWIEEKLVADQATADRFDALKQQHAKDPVVANAATRDEVVLHVAPGRESEHFFRLPEGAPLSLLGRAMVAKPIPAGTRVAPPTAPKDGVPSVPEGPVMEDWWLVRDARGDTGWIYSHLIDVTAPDVLSRYAEGQRFVAAYVLANVEDPESGVLNNGVTVTSIPEYLTVLSPYKAGLPYDFDQVRVFTWNTRKHRYETAFRDHNILGYLPVKITAKADPYGKSATASVLMPAFTYNVLSADAPTPGPDASGMVVPSKTVEKAYRMEGTAVRRLLQPGTQAPAEAHPVDEEKKDKKSKKAAAKKK